MWTLADRRVLFGLDPNFGRSAGGDQINVFWANLENATRVRFGSGARSDRRNSVSFRRRTPDADHYSTVQRIPLETDELPTLR